MPRAIRPDVVAAVILLFAAASARAQEGTRPALDPPEPLALPPDSTLPALREAPGPGRSEAEQAVEMDLTQIDLRDLLAVKIGVASKIAERSEDAPSSVSVFTRREITMLGVTDLEELLNFVPGFQVTRDVEQGTAARLGVRGRSSAIGESILFLLNGQRLNDLYSGGVSILNRHIAVGNLERVEILRGPGSALYGANAFTGVVNLVTSDDRTDAVFSAGSFGSREGALNISSAGDDNDLRFSGFVHGFSDEGELYKNLTDSLGRTGDTVDPRSGLDAQGTLRYKKLSLFVRHMERNLEDFLAFGVLQPLRNNAQEKTRQDSATLRAAFQWAPAVKLDFVAGYSQDRWQSVFLSIPADATATSGHSTHAGPFIETYAVNAGTNAEFALRERNTLVAGAGYEAAGITTVANLFDFDPATGAPLGEVREFGSPSETFNEKKTRHTFCLFGQDQQQFGKWLTLVAGLRFDWYNDFGYALSPRASAVVATPIDSRIKLIYGRAFRAPSFLELYDKNNPADFGNPNLDAEKLDTLEVAYIQTIAEDLLNVGVNYYYTHFRDLIAFGVPVVAPNNPFGARQFVNAGSADNQGLELELKAQPIKALFLTATYSHLLGKGVGLMTKDAASLAANYQFRKLTFGTTSVVRGKVNGATALAPYWLLNGGVRYAVTPKLGIRFDVRNILDSQNRTPSNFLPDGVANRGRAFMLSILYAR